MNEALRDELLGLREEDQVAARAALEVSERDPRFRGKFLFQISEDEWVSEFRDAAEICRRHTVRLVAIIDRFGWPGRSIVGPDGAEAAWLLLQHAGSDVQRRCLPVLREALDAGEATAQHVAAVTDRIELEEGRLQVYGTHLAMDDGMHVPMVGVSEPRMLDDRRAALGLESWEEYVRNLGGDPGFAWRDDG